MVLACSFDDELDGVVRCVGLEARGDVPTVRAGVLDVVGDGHDGDNVVGRAAEEEEGAVACSYSELARVALRSQDWSMRRTLRSWRPGDGIRSAGRNELVGAWSDDGVAGWVSAGGCCESGRHGGEARDQSRDGKIHVGDSSDEWNWSREESRQSRLELDSGEKKITRDSKERKCLKRR